MNLNQLLGKIPELVSFISLLSYFVISLRILKEDREFGKIRNKEILLGIKVIFFLLLIHLSNTIAGYFGYNNNYLNLEFYKAYIINFVYSLVFSYILWYAEIWPAGDSKYFILNLIFLPLINFRINGFPHNLWIIVLINIFIVASVISIFNYFKENIILMNMQNVNAFNEIKKLYYEKLKKIDFKSSEIYLTIGSILSIFTYKQTINIFIQNYIIKIFHRTDIFFFLLFFLWPKISSFFKTKYWKYIIISFYSILFLTLFLIPDPIKYIKTIFKMAILNTFKFSLVLFIAKAILEDILENSNTYYVSKDEIKEGMVLHSEELQIIRQNPIFNGIFDDCFKDGLNSEQVKALKDWLARLPQENPKLRFVKTKPFGMYIFLGSILHLILNKNLVKYFLR
jgi:ABC-type multidrug transport system fused ATPase/permease subunit